MPAQKMIDPNAALTGTMDFSGVKTTWVGAKDAAPKNMPSDDCTPSQPPWTTFTGILEARRDSVVGKRILAMDPKATEGKHKHHTASEWVRGVWTAPENWNEIENY
jgi:hypothetical protein